MGVEPGTRPRLLGGRHRSVSISLCHVASQVGCLDVVHSVGAAPADRQDVVKARAHHVRVFDVRVDRIPAESAGPAVPAVHLKVVDLLVLGGVHAGTSQVLAFRVLPAGPLPAAFVGACLSEAVLWGEQGIADDALGDAELYLQCFPSHLRFRCSSSFAVLRVGA